ncbi:cytochrome C [Chryseobacterium sp.]|uniref:cytochrome C n=1 Tax=Chryseobacterium sp. TaxID=1871047 RepID=UPI0011C78808|nr:cytochrome C [Chryseobacterium sp.]TXF75871.1 cytochrome C [Chryseobacterium sp.]
MIKNVMAATCGITLFLISCTPKVTTVTTVNTNTSDKLAQGKTIFDNSCKRCHDLPNPADHSAQDWVGILNRMAPKAKLSDEQHQLVYDFVAAGAKK